MLSLPPTVRVFVAVAPLDMRGSLDSLAGAVRHLGLDAVDGHLYLFLNKRRRIAKALWFDGSGWYRWTQREKHERRSTHIFKCDLHSHVNELEELRRDNSELRRQILALTAQIAELITEFARLNERVSELLAVAQRKQ